MCNICQNQQDIYINEKDFIKRIYIKGKNLIIEHKPVYNDFTAPREIHSFEFNFLV